MSASKRLPMAGGPGPIEDLAAWKAEALEKIDGRPVVISVSGGKDSTALALLMIEAGIPYTAVHMDTGWEHQDTVDYVRDYLPTVIGPVAIIQSEKGGMVEWIRHKGMFPSRVRRWCTEYLKVIPFRDYLRTMDDEPVNAVGVGAAESAARSKLPEWEHMKALDVDVWRPLIYWSEQDVIEMHQRHGVKPNPLYLKGARRVGCWPCIHQRKDEVRLMAKIDPGRIDYLEALEAEVTIEQGHRRAARGLEAYAVAAWFVAKVGRSGGCWPIRKVVDWSRTARGGRQTELFGPPEDEGCMRWGMCDTAPPTARQPHHVLPDRTEGRSVSAAGPTGGAE